MSDRATPILPHIKLPKLKPLRNGYTLSEEEIISEVESIDGLPDDLLIRQDEQIPDPTPVILIDGITTGTLANISGMTGKAKGMKSTATSLICAAAIASKQLPRITVNKPLGKIKVLVFDTEQSRAHTAKWQRKTLNAAGLTESDNLLVYNLRKLDVLERVEAIEKIIQKTDEVLLVVIDGIRDLIYDINNAEESSRVITKLLKWSEERDIHIICILHQNKGNEFVRGHQGSELMNKCEFLLSVTKDKNLKSTAIVAPEYVRNQDISEFVIKVGDDGVPYVSDENPALNEEPNRGGLKFHQIPEETHRKILTEALIGTTPTYNELTDLIRTEFERYGTVFGISKAKQFVTEYKKLKWVIEFKPEGERYNRYSLSG